MGERFDVVVVGGGITGAGIARDCAMRGLSTALLERGSPGGETTASSSHLIHGGLRYLLYDRLTTLETSFDCGKILAVARPLLTRLPILWPVYEGHAHGIETVETLLSSYDGFQSLKGGRPHLRLGPEEAVRAVPGLKGAGLVGACVFDEWWVDPVKLVEANLDSARRFGARVRSGAAASAVLRGPSGVEGVSCGGERIEASLVINAAGPWAGEVAAMAGISAPLSFRRGAHLVYQGRLAPMGLLLEAADRKRYVFLLPLGQSTLLGPTDVAHPGRGEGPGPIAADPGEIRYLLDSARRYFPDFPERFDSVSCGVRPIVGRGSGAEGKLLSREFEVLDHESRDGLAGFVSVQGGKMSDYRLMAEAACELAMRKLGRRAPCRTHLESLAGGAASYPGGAPLKTYRRPLWGSLLRRHPRLRQAHALGYLGAALLAHWTRIMLRGRRLVTAERLREVYGLTDSMVPPPSTQSPS